ncbi:MAG: bacterioferritin [Rhodospirillales bacterium]|nr:bacterioferritin [Rhodospirillales bacterium]
MKGDKKVIKQLNLLLSGELTAVDQYLVHAKMYEDWGLNELHEHTKHEMEEEQDHARRLIERILFLEGVPDVAARSALCIGKDTPSMLKNDLQVELEVVEALKAAIVICEKASDFVSRDLLVELLDDTEMDHTYWLEKQLGLIDKMGLQNYLQSKSA